VSRQQKGGNQRILAALDRKVDIQFTGQQLREVMGYFETQENFNIKIDTDALKEAGVREDVEINLILSGVSLRTALDRMLARVGGVALDYVIDNEVLTITTRQNADMFIEPMIYDLQGVASTNPEQLAQILETAVAPESWKTKGGLGSTIILQNSVLVTQTQRNHWQIASLLEMLTRQSQVALFPKGPQKASAPADAPAVDPRKYALTGQPAFADDGRPQVVDFRRIPEAEQRIYSALQQKVDLQLTGLGLTEVAQFLATQHNINIKIDASELNLAKVPLDTEIHLVASGLTLENALGLMFKDVAGKKLDYLIENEMLVVTTAERAKATKETRIYDVRGITSDPQLLVPLLSRWCGPEDAKAAAGGLIVTASQPAHREVLPFLETLTEFRQRGAAAEEAAKKPKAAAATPQNR
jgi:hypothetical protein